MKDFRDYINDDSRHNLLFMSIPEDMKSLDIGFELSKLLLGKEGNRNFSLYANDALDKIVKSSIEKDPQIGYFLAIKNIGILFEPSLKIDVRSKIDQWAKSLALIIDSDEGSIQNDIFYLASTREEKYSINLKDISHKTI